MLEPERRGGVYAAIHAIIGGHMTAAERRLIDKALDQIKALRDLNR